MKNFIFKSTDADFKKMFSIIERIDKNVLYTTYRMDIVNKWIHDQETEKGLQTQVDEYFDEHHDAYEEEHSPMPTLHPKDKTSPQTDTDEQE